MAVPHATFRITLIPILNRGRRDFGNWNGFAQTNGLTGLPRLEIFPLLEAGNSELPGENRIDGGRIGTVVDRCAFLEIGEAERGVVAHQKTQNVLPILTGREMSRRVSLITTPHSMESRSLLLIHVRSLLQEILHDLRISRQRRHHHCIVTRPLFRYKASIRCSSARR